MKDKTDEKLVNEVPAADDLDIGITPYVRFQLTQGAISDNGATSRPPGTTRR
jgi:peptidyl-tRNA hydrolase